MRKEFTAEFMLSHRGCYSKEQMNDNVIQGREVITLDDFLNTAIPLKDKYYFVVKYLCDLSQKIEIAKKCAQIVSPLKNAYAAYDGVGAAYAAYADAAYADAADAAADTKPSCYTKQLTDFLIEYCKNA